MIYEEALGLVGHLPTWELRELVSNRRVCPRFNSARERYLAGAAELVLRFRVSALRNPATFSCRLTC